MRSVSGFEIYRKTYRDTITPARVAELLILRADMPRSLMAAMNALCNQLGRLSNKRSAQTIRQAGLLQAQIQFASIDDILQQGLHAYLTQFLERINVIGQGISQDFFDEVEEAGEKLSTEIREATFALPAPPAENMFKYVYSDPHPRIQEQFEWIKKYEASFGEDAHA